MKNGLVLPHLVPTPGDLRLEDAWVGRQLGRLDEQIIHGELGPAAQGCQCLLSELESHCALEEMLMARIDFPWAPVHCADHVVLLVSVANLLREIRRGISDSGYRDSGSSLRQQVSAIALEARIHVMREDARLQRFAARMAAPLRQ